MTNVQANLNKQAKIAAVDCGIRGCFDRRADELIEGDWPCDRSPRRSEKDIENRRRVRRDSLACDIAVSAFFKNQQALHDGEISRFRDIGNIEDSIVLKAFADGDGAQRTLAALAAVSLVMYDELAPLDFVSPGPLRRLGAQARYPRWHPPI
jgi:hypothetical protein